MMVDGLTHYQIALRASSRVTFSWTEPLNFRVLEGGLVSLDQM